MAQCTLPLTYEIPVEMWDKIFHWLPAADRRTFLWVSPMHRDIARRVLFSTIKIHLEPTYFDSEGVHYPGGELGGADDHALLETDTGTKSYKLIDTIVKDHQFASLVKTVVFFAEDSPRTQCEFLQGSCSLNLQIAGILQILSP